MNKKKVSGHTVQRGFCKYELEGIICTNLPFLPTFRELKNSKIRQSWRTHCILTLCWWTHCKTAVLYTKCCRVLCRLLPFFPHPLPPVSHSSRKKQKKNYYYKRRKLPSVSDTILTGEAKNEGGFLHKLYYWTGEL